MLTVLSAMPGYREWREDKKVKWNCRLADRFLSLLVLWLYILCCRAILYGTPYRRMQKVQEKGKEIPRAGSLRRRKQVGRNCWRVRIWSFHSIGIVWQRPFRRKV